MKKNIESESKILRQKAEELLNKSASLSKTSKTTLPLSKNEMLKLIHELEVHRIELEMQNNELQLAKEVADIATEKYTHLYDFAPSGYLTISVEGKIIELNLTSAKMLGKGRSELINSRFGFFVSSDTRTVFNLFLDKVFESKSQESCEVTLLMDDEIATFVLLTGLITENEHQCNVTMVDITGRKQEEEKLKASNRQLMAQAQELSRMATVIKDSNDAITIQDLEGNITAWNSGATKMYGYNEKEAFKMNVADMVPEEYKTEALNFIVNLKNGELVESLETKRQTSKGKILDIWMVVTKLTDENGKLIGVATTERDITERKRAEVELLKYREYLEELVSERTSELKSAMIKLEEEITERKRFEEEIELKNEELQKLNSTKDKFFSIIAHDLKSPFNSIIGFSDLLVEQINEKDYDGIEKYAGIIQQSSERAMDLLMNLMEWARSQTGRMEFAPADLEMVNLIGEISLLFDDIAGQKSITIIRNLPPNAIVFADRAMISTVLRNLISNAIKFTHPGGKIIISAELSQNEVKVSVSDNGVGIPKSSVEKLFRIDENYSTPGTQKEKGTGLGLILCKEFVEKHGGRIWVESDSDGPDGYRDRDRQGKGSIFYFTLPCIK